MTNKNRVLVIFSSLFSLVVVFAGLAMAQMAPIYRFKGVQISVTMRIDNKVFEKGAYDLQFLRTSSPVLYFLRIMKAGKILATLQGAEWPYSNGLVDTIAFSSEVPQKPTLRMALKKSEKLLSLTFESGKNALEYPFIRAKFNIPYEE